MVAALDAWAIEYGAVRLILRDHLTLEDPPILERQMKHIALGCVGHRVKSHDR